MASISKFATYAAWISIALAAAAARPAHSEVRDLDASGGEPIAGAQVATVGLGDAPTFPNGTDIEDLDDLLAEPGSSDPGAPSVEVSTMLVGTWGWEGSIEGMPAYVETAFHADGTYQSYAETPILQVYEVGYWALIEGVLTTAVVDYAPRLIDTPYGPQPLQIEPEYSTELAFVDEDTVETEIGLSYRID